MALPVAARASPGLPWHSSSRVDLVPRLALDRRVPHYTAQRLSGRRSSQPLRCRGTDDTSPAPLSGLRHCVFALVFSLQDSAQAISSADQWSNIFVGPSSLELLLAVLVGWTAARLVGRKRRSQPTSLGSLDHVASLAQSAQSAAVVHELTVAGVMDALPPPEAAGLSADELARRCCSVGEHSCISGEELGRLLHHIALKGIVQEGHSGAGSPRFRHSAWSQDLAKGGKARTQALVHLSPAQLRPWWRIREALTSDNDDEPFRLEHGGLGVFEYYADPANTEAAGHFDKLMRELSHDASASQPAQSVAELVARLPLWADVVETAADSPPPTVVDVGGGQGQLLEAVLSHHPRLHGILFDRPDVVATRPPSPYLHRDLAVRTSAVGGDFFAADGGSLPGTADVFMLKSILHDWSNARCRRILRGLRSAIESRERRKDSGPQRGGKRPCVLLVEETRPEDTDASDAAAAERRRSSDAYMWVVYGGQERTVSAYTALLEAEGFATERVTHLDGFRLVAIEARPAWTQVDFGKDGDEAQGFTEARQVCMPA